MKSVKKIFFFAVLCATLFIIFKPAKKNPNLNGSWTVIKFTEGDIAIPFKGTANFSNGRITVYGHNEYLLKEIGAESRIVNDSLLITSDVGSIFEGMYNIDVQSEVFGSGASAWYEYELNLTSVNKKITMVRAEPVKWNKGAPPKGRP